jgi:hypothetical protein
VSWTSKVMMTRTRTNSCAATHMRNSATIFLASPLPPAEQVRTFLNCHKLFLNTVSISLRAKIKPARDLHIGIARFVLAGFVERGATHLWHSFCSISPALPSWGPSSFFRQKKKQTGAWSTLCGMNDIRPLVHLHSSLVNVED